MPKVPSSGKYDHLHASLFVIFGLLDQDQILTAGRTEGLCQQQDSQHRQTVHNVTKTVSMSETNTHK